MQAAIDLKSVIVLDGIDILPDNSGFQVRCHDLQGLLPEIVLLNSGDTFVDKDRLGNRVCWLVAIVKLRDEIVRFLPGCKLLPPTSIDGKAIAEECGSGLENLRFSLEADRIRKPKSKFSRPDPNFCGNVQSFC